MARLRFAKRLLPLLAAATFGTAAPAAEVVPLASGPVAAEPRPLEVQLNSRRVMLVYLSADGRSFAERADLAGLGLLFEPLSRLARTEVEGCHDCIALADIGGVLREDSASASAQLAVAPRFLPPKLHALDPGRRETLAAVPYRGRPGSLLDYQLLAARNKNGSQSASFSYGGLFSFTQGLPGDALLRLGAAALHAGRQTRVLMGDSYLEKPLPKQAVVLRVGDSRSPADSFFGSARVLGVHAFTSRALREDLFSNPYYQFSFESRAPGVVEIFRDGALAGRQDIEAGTVTLQDLPASRQGDVRLVVKNVLGEEQVIYAPLFSGSQFLAQGQKQGGISLGVEHSGDRTGPALAVGQLAMGLTSALLGRGQVEVGERALRTSLGVDAGSRYGRFGLASGWSRSDDRSAVLARADWRYLGRSGTVPLELGLTTVQSFQPRSQTLVSAFVTRVGPQWATTGSAFLAGQQYGFNVGVGRGYKAFSVAALVGYSEGSGVQGALRFSYSPAAWLRSGVSALYRGQNRGGRFTANAGTAGQQWNATALAAGDFNGESATSYQVVGGYRGSAGQVDADLAEVGGSTRQSLRGQGALAFDGLRPLPLPNGYSQGGYAVVQTHLPGTDVDLLGQTRRSNAQGRAYFPVPAYQPLTPFVRFPGAEGLGSDTTLAAARIRPGQKIVFELEALTGFLLQLPRENLPVQVNGAVVPVSGYYAQLDGLKLGDNQVRIAERDYPLYVENPQGGVYALDAAGERLRRSE